VLHCPPHPTKPYHNIYIYIFTAQSGQQNLFCLLLFLFFFSFFPLHIGFTFLYDAMKVRLTTKALTCSSRPYCCLWWLATTIEPEMVIHVLPRFCGHCSAQTALANGSLRDSERATFLTHREWGWQRPLITSCSLRLKAGRFFCLSSMLHKNPNG